MSFPSSDPGVARWTPNFATAPQKDRSRTQSISSDRPSTVAHSLMSPSLSVSPEAAFIAAAAASQIVTNDHDAHAATWYDQQGVEPPAETVLVSPAALSLVNGFLDHLLFNFLCTAGSTNLASLRPAVSDVLKPKLASDAINQADEELREYLGGAEDEDYGGSQASKSPRDWDVELIWKRTRLRCMVYSSLGDLEEEDEDFFMEQEDLAGDESEYGVSPAVAIFLTSILEFMGEQALIVAGAIAGQRMRNDYEKGLRDGSREPGEVVNRIVVEEGDMERVALDRTLGRLWRTWKKKKFVRSPKLSQDPPFARAYSRNSTRQSTSGHSAKNSLNVETASALVEGQESQRSRADEAPKERRPEGSDLEEEVLAASIPLPIGPNDVSEILIPGLASYVDEDGGPGSDRSTSQPVRPKSMMLLGCTNVGGLPTPASSEPQTPLPSPRKRANSLPTFATFTYMSPPAKRAKVQPSPSAGLAETKTAETGRDRPTETIATGISVPAPPSPPLSGEPESRVNIDPEQLEVINGRRKSSAQISAMIAGATGGAASRLPPTEYIAAKSTLDEVDEIDEFSEEPEILTSSRVSISGRSTSPSTSVRERGKPAITIGIPTRSASVHSVRMIEVHTPKSPVSRSRGSSADAQERTSLRSITLSRADSVSTPPIREEHRQQGSPSKKCFPLPSGKPTLIHNDAISEAEETAGMGVGRAISAPMAIAQSTAAGPKPHYEELESRVQSSEAIFGSVPRQMSPPHSPVRTIPTTTRSAAATNADISAGTSFFDDKPEVLPKSPSVANRRPVPPMLPERSSHRPGGSSTPSPKEWSTMGVVSVDRSSPRAETSEFPREHHTHPKVQEQSSGLAHEPVSSISSQQRRKPVRTSQESASRDSAATAEDVARNFEELMKSDQTIQYTLTPESMRDIDSVRSAKVESPLMRPKSRKSDDVQTHRSDRTRSSSTSTTRAAGSRRSTSISQTGLNSHPVNSSGAATIKLSGPIPRAPPGVTPLSRGGGAKARDARVPRESLADFADFIRATGPPGATGSANRTGPPVSMSGAAGVGEPTVGTTLTRSSTVSSSQTRQRYQARDPVVDPREDNSDLIDFIRRGPPSSRDPRIPRTVAPFRTTMDSDQFAAAAGGKAVDATIPDIRHSAASTSITEHSLPSSINSSSALLRKDKALPSRSGSMVDEDDMMPKRKTRRPRDPYAIDSDDEDDDGEPTPRPVRRLPQPPAEEESLADFLKNVPPPKETPPVPFHLSGSQAHGRPPAPKKKASAPSLMARFTRRESGSPTTGSFGHGFGSRSSPKAPEPVAPASRASGGRGYIPIQVNMPPGVGDGSGYGANISTGPSMNGGPRPTTGPAVGGPRVQMKKFEPREAVMVRSRGTSDLADFLRHSEPPRDLAGTIPNYGAVDHDVGGGGGLGKRFSRRN